MGMMMMMMTTTTTNSPRRCRLPRDLSRLTKAQFEAGVVALAKKSLAHLRRDQRVIQAQIQHAITAEAIRNLNVMYDLRTAAIDRKCFPPNP